VMVDLATFTVNVDAKVRLNLCCSSMSVYCSCL